MRRLSLLRVGHARSHTVETWQRRRVSASSMSDAFLYNADHKPTDVCPIALRSRFVALTRGDAAAPLTATLDPVTNGSSNSDRSSSSSSSSGSSSSTSRHVLFLKNAIHGLRIVNDPDLTKAFLAKFVAPHLAALPPDVLTLALQAYPADAAGFHDALNLLASATPASVNEQHLTAVLALGQRAASAPHTPPAAALDIVHRGKTVYDTYIAGSGPSPGRGTHATPTPTLTPRRPSAVLGNAALSLYTRLPGPLLKAHPYLLADALALLGALRAAQAPRPLHATTYGTLVACAGRAGRRDLVEEVWGEMHRAGATRSAYAVTARLGAVAACGDLAEANRCYEALLRACQGDQGAAPSPSGPIPSAATDGPPTTPDAPLAELPTFSLPRRHPPLPAVSALLRCCLGAGHGALGLRVLVDYLHRAGVTSATVDWPLAETAVRLMALDRPYPAAFERLLQARSSSSSGSNGGQSSSSSSSGGAHTVPSGPTFGLKKPLTNDAWRRRRDDAFSRLVNVLLAHLLPPSREFPRGPYFPSQGGEDGAGGGRGGTLDTSSGSGSGGDDIRGGGGSGDGGGGRGRDVDAPSTPSRRPSPSSSSSNGSGSSGGERGERVSGLVRRQGAPAVSASAVDPLVLRTIAAQLALRGQVDTLVAVLGAAGHHDHDRDGDGKGSDGGGNQGDGRGGAGDAMWSHVARALREAGRGRDLLALVARVAPPPALSPDTTATDAPTHDHAAAGTYGVPWVGPVGARAVAREAVRCLRDHGDGLRAGRLAAMYGLDAPPPAQGP